MFLLRVIVFLILLSLILILAYPLLIVFNIASGGDGFGLCNDLATCIIPVSEGPKLLIYLIGIFFLLVLLLRLIMKYMNSLQSKNSIL
ncbi:hypothetical protein N9C54_03460 [Acidimicrobiia bacterium]|jgi:hypothetical protein|nr:hypothetical protein [Actinomycetota bacterium]MDA7543485.1 hypothetical protein [Acidimicrobiia bacterium]MBT5655197.1 hypothetical protein [Actinomycetota bacterium]MBT7014026.1 hypothetical protein [Actinomycetota bacterium]MDA9844966.1 hypothetical protein [Acidimicrobiia bacterium]|tara:strand:+ start:5695 stop:5958 length:264 start_codon:yes stop_codon:yes gene_type:complete